MTFGTIKKSQTYRVKESIKLLKKIRDLGINSDNTGLKEFRKHLNEYIKNNEGWTGKVKIIDTDENKPYYIHAILSTTRENIVKISKK